MSKFIAAMDHSGGSTGGVLERYGEEYTEDNKMDKVHSMRLRMVDCPAFTNNNISGAILYKDTVDRGMVPILRKKGISPYLKIDSGCDDAGMLKPFGVEDMCNYARAHNMIGTKMRSIIKTERWLHHILEQQFRFASFIADKGLIPIVEPEIPIDSKDKPHLEDALAKALPTYLSEFKKSLILKLTIPEKPYLYSSLYLYNNVAKIVALSGGYSTDDACAKLKHQNMGASFSRALSEGLYADQTDNQFNIKLADNIQKIKAAASWR
jgi:fructose-bisphosphate aldolase class I